MRDGDGRVEVKVLVRVDMVERKAGVGIGFELGDDFRL